jgi:nucleotide-binding universal stress UspA family protein
MMPTFDRILVPIDFSEYSDAALRYAIALARQFGSSLYLLHVLDDPFATGAWASEIAVPETPGLRDSLRREAEQRLNRYFSPEGWTRFRVTTEAVTGSPAQSIVDFARDCAADLIVMGTHGRTGVAHLLVGSVAERVVRLAPCPVLAVRPTSAIVKEVADPALVAAAPPA